MLRVGTSGWQYKHWRGRFYPLKLPSTRWLEHYAARFATVEVNNTFYRLPKPDTFADWAKRVPADFDFAIKASNYLTHYRRVPRLAHHHAGMAHGGLVLRTLSLRARTAAVVLRPRRVAIVGRAPGRGPRHRRRRIRLLQQRRERVRGAGRGGLRSRRGRGRHDS